MSAFRLAFERQKASFVTSAYGYRTPEAACHAAPTINSVRVSRTFYPYTHIAEFERGRVIRLVPLAEAA